MIAALTGSAALVTVGEIDAFLSDALKTMRPDMVIEFEFAAGVQQCLRSLALAHVSDMRASRAAPRAFRAFGDSL